MRERQIGLWVYFAVGVAFGILLTRAEVISWFRIQEMFRFQAWHMFGIFSTALPTAIISVQLMKRRGRSLGGESVRLEPKVLGTGRRYIFGGVLFGIGWALVGACPGPLFALLGSGVSEMAFILASALAGTWTYGRLRPILPH